MARWTSNKGSTTCPGGYMKVGSFVIALALVVAGASSGRADVTKPNDPLFAAQWNLRQVHAPEAWRHSTGAGVIIATVASGMDSGHPDLAGKVLRGYACTGEERAPQDKWGIGTFMAGVMAARTNNRVGVAGIAPGARILPIGDSFSAECSPAGQAASVRWAADQGADVIALDWFTTDVQQAVLLPGQYAALKRAVEYAVRRGAVVVAPAAHWMPLCAEPWRGTPVLCVGSVNRHGTLATASSFDAAMQSNYLVAPAGEYFGTGGMWHVPCEEGIVSTWPRGLPGENLTECGVGNGYSVTATNRIAVAHVAGVAALLAAQGRDHRAITKCLLTRADDLGAPGRDPIYGFGLVNALRAVRDC